MKAVMEVLLIFAAACMIFPATAFSSFGSTSTFGTEISQSWASSSDAKRMEDKMTEVLGDLETFKSAKINKKERIILDSSTNVLKSAGPLNKSTSRGTSLNNSSRYNSTWPNSTLMESSALNSSALNKSANNRSHQDSGDVPSALAGTLSSNSSMGSQEVGTNSKASFNGYYGVTASRHEMGKSDIKSSTFLSGGFNVDKTVQFSDRNF